LTIGADDRRIALLRLRAGRGDTRAVPVIVLSAGVVTDYVYGAEMHWQGGRGGFPCDGGGSLNEWNVIGELKAATPLGGGNTLNGYIGAGAAIFWPSGHPTGGTTSFLGARPRRPCALGGAWILITSHMTPSGYRYTA
jgi:hypothetical protein